MKRQEHYEQLDLPFYRAEVAPILPEEVLDFHAHTWKREHWTTVPWETDAAGARYVVTIEEYGIEQLLADGKGISPDRPYQAVCFGYPIPAADVAKTNAYVARAVEHRGLYPLLIVGRDMLPQSELEQAIREGGFFGYKVYLNWYGDDYGQATVGDLIGPSEMDLTNELGLVVLLHLPRAKRLLFGTDLPIAAMRGRRVAVMDHWVDVVLEGYPASAYRVAPNDIRATFMVYEIIVAIRLGAEMTGLEGRQASSIFFENGMALLRRVMGGEQLKAAQSRCALKTTTP